MSKRTTPSAEAAATPPSEGGELAEGLVSTTCGSGWVNAQLSSLEIMDVRKVATLAHLEISEEEVALYTPQMAGIVKYVEQLNELDIDDIDPMLGGLTDEGEATATTREDVVRPSLSQDDALSQAPSPVAGHFQVPKVL